ncbi:MAG: hypothetical protein DRI74_03870 [Bacteroidetes bacterium]|nr:MAG: hypothetical protein DRI74_03870 [Bacteroidota bacterium]
MNMLSKKWVLILINAILVISFGIMLIFVPVEILKNLVFIIGTVIAFVGLILIFGAFNYTKENKNMIFWLFQGLFNMVVGGIVMFFPEASIKFLLILAGIWAIVLGVYQFSVSLLPQIEINGKIWHKINGLLAVIIGILLIFAPEIITGIALGVFGFLLLIIGGGMLYFSILLKHLGEIEEVEEVEEVEEEIYTQDIDTTIDDDTTL